MPTIVSRGPRLLGALVAALIATPGAHAALKDNIVAYWPLDEVAGTKTPDLVRGLDMELVNLTEADLVEGKRGKAFHFDNAKQTLLRRVHAAGEALPINQYPALTISFWAKVTGAGQTDLRLFSEGSTVNNNPLFNLGTDSTGVTIKGFSCAWQGCPVAMASRNRRSLSASG